MRYLIEYRDVNRWGESQAYSRADAFNWIAQADKSFLEIEIYLGPKVIGSWRRDERCRLHRIWNAA